MCCTGALPDDHKIPPYWTFYDYSPLWVFPLFPAGQKMPPSPKIFHPGQHSQVGVELCADSESQAGFHRIEGITSSAALEQHQRISDIYTRDTFLCSTDPKEEKQKSEQALPDGKGKLEALFAPPSESRRHSPNSCCRERSWGRLQRSLGWRTAAQGLL